MSPVIGMFPRMATRHIGIGIENRSFENSMFWVSGLSAVKGIQILKSLGLWKFTCIHQLDHPLSSSTHHLCNR